MKIIYQLSTFIFCLTASVLLYSGPVDTRDLVSKDIALFCESNTCEQGKYKFNECPSYIALDFVDNYDAEDKLRLQVYRERTRMNAGSTHTINQPLEDKYYYEADSLYVDVFRKRGGTSERDFHMYRLNRKSLKGLVTPYSITKNNSNYDSNEFEGYDSQYNMICKIEPDALQKIRAVYQNREIIRLREITKQEQIRLKEYEKKMDEEMKKRAKAEAIRLRELEKEMQRLERERELKQLQDEQNRGIRKF